MSPVLRGLGLCAPEDQQLREKLLRLKLEALVRSGGEEAAREAMETFSQVLIDPNIAVLHRDGRLRH